MLSDRYEIEEAESGEEAIYALSDHGPEFSLVLLDIIMPKMDGLTVLELIRRQKWIEGIPVIIISSEQDHDAVRRAYELGAADYIGRPFDAGIVRQRVANTILLYNNQKRMADLVSRKLFENVHQSSLMIAVLSHLVEFRNGESGSHVLNITAITRLLLQRLFSRPDTAERYRLTPEDISLISRAAALHDIGKIAISGEILNKPGPLTDEEFAVMKTHSAAGAEILQNLGRYRDEPIIKYAIEICRWHHERWDGGGYPDGLYGNEIPISAQTVSLADVYDALTSKRCYKKAYSHREAIRMIQNGECGAFNPLLLECLLAAEDELQAVKSSPESYSFDCETEDIQQELQQNDSLTAASEMLQRIQSSRVKLQFLAEEISDPVFGFYYSPPIFEFSAAAVEQFGLQETIIDPLHNDALTRITGKAPLEEGLRLAAGTCPEHPDFSLIIPITARGRTIRRRVRCRTVWAGDPPRLDGMVGRVLMKEDIK